MDPITTAENNFLARREARDAVLDQTAAELKAEYLEACKSPMISTVSTPGYGKPRQLIVDVWADGISERRLAARAISILMRSEEGRALMDEMATAHGDWFWEDVAA